MKIKVLDYFIINKTNEKIKIIFDVNIIENKNESLLNKIFINNNGNLSFKVISVGHVNPLVDNFYPLIIETNKDNFEEYKGIVFTDKK